MPIREARLRQIAAVPLFKHRDSPGVEPQDSTHVAGPDKRHFISAPQHQCFVREGRAIDGIE